MLIPSLIFCICYLIAMAMICLQDRYQELTMGRRVFYCVLFFEGTLIHGILFYLLCNIPR